MISQLEIEAAENRIKPYLTPTPVVRSDHYSSLLSAEVYFKLESMQPTRSFKVRGAFNAALSRSDQERTRGMMTATGGNHGLALAYVARQLAVPAAIFVPETTSQARQELIRHYGAQVTVHGRSWDDANKKAISVAREEDQIYVHPFNDRRMIAGAATIVTELMRQIGEVDLLIASIGGGGLISGLLSAVKHLSPQTLRSAEIFDSANTRVIGVETLGTDSMFQSMRHDHLVELPAITSIATSLGARQPGELTFDIVRHNVTDLVTVTDKEAVAAAFDLLEHEKLLVEPAASCCLAALTSGKIQVKKGEKVAVIICGANSSLLELLKWGRDYSLDPLPS